MIYMAKTKVKWDVTMANNLKSDFFISFLLALYLVVICILF